MKAIYLKRQIVRAGYILFTTFISIKLIIVAATITNITGLFPNFANDNLYLHNAKMKIFYWVVLILSATLAYLAIEYFIRRRIRKQSDELPQWMPSGKITILISYFYFIILSFMNFVFTLHFISSKFINVTIFTTLLNFIPIYLIYKINLDRLKITNMKIIFGLTTLGLSLVTVFPFGSIALPFFVNNLL